MYIHAPCKDCEKRKIGGHSSCNDYLKFRERLDDAKKAEKLDRQLLFNPRISRKSK